MSDIRISYVLSPTWGREASELDAADETALRYRYFLGDAILEIGNVDASAPWGWVPILDFALGLRAIADRLAASDEDQVFEFTESDASISFRKRDGIVVVDPSYVDGSAEVRVDELVAASREFLASLLRDLVDRHPDLRNNEFVARLSKSGTPVGDS